MICYLDNSATTRACPACIEAVSYTHLAKESGTINYEIVCQVSKRVPRIYLDQWGETVDVIDHICPNEIKEYTV